MMNTEPYYKYFSNEKQGDQQMQKLNTTTVNILCPEGCVSLNWEWPTFSKSEHLGSYSELRATTTENYREWNKYSLPAHI